MGGGWVVEAENKVAKASRPEDNLNIKR